MKTIVFLKSKLPYGIMTILVFVLGACSGYYIGVPIDDIYGYHQIEIQHTNPPERDRSSFYKNYFNNLSEQESFHQKNQAQFRDSSYIDPERYSDAPDYQTYGPWGQTPSTTRIIINNYHPFDYDFGFYNRPWGFGFRPFYGYGHRPFFSYHRSFYRPWHRFHHPWNDHWHYPDLAFNPYFEYGYSTYWTSNPYSYWNPYPYYGHRWGYPLAYRNYRTEGYAGVSYVRNRRNQPIESSESETKKTRKAKEPKNYSSSNSLSTQLALSRLQSSLVTPRYYGSQNPVLSRSKSYGSTASTLQGSANNTKVVASRSRTESTSLSNNRQTIQKKSQANTPRYQVSTSRGGANASIDSPRKSNINSNIRSGQPRTHRSNVQSYRRAPTSLKRTNSQQSSVIKSKDYNDRSPSSSTQSSSNENATPSRTRYSQPKVSRSYQSNDSSYRSSSRSISVSRSQPNRSTYSSSRSSSSNSRGRSSSSSRRN